MNHKYANLEGSSSSFHPPIVLPHLLPSFGRLHWQRVKLGPPPTTPGIAGFQEKHASPLKLVSFSPIFTRSFCNPRLFYRFIFGAGIFGKPTLEVQHYLCSLLALHPLQCVCTSFRKHKYISVISLSQSRAVHDSWWPAANNLQVSVNRKRRSLPT